MKHAHRFLVLLALSFAPAAAPSADSIAWKVEAKSKLAKTFETQFELTSTEFKITLGGEPLAGFGQPTFHIKDSETIKVTDEYVTVADGRATKLQRTFDDLGGEETQSYTQPEGAEGNPTVEKSEKSSPLENQGVVFTWDAKADEYTTAWAEGSKGASKLLEKLHADMDMLEFLPGKSVSSGDTWDLGTKPFERLLSPGGRLELKPENSEDSSSDEIHEQFVENLEGKGKATYEGLRDVDGGKLAVIKIVAEFHSHAAMSEDGGEGEMKIEFKLEGEVLWDAKAGHFRSFEIKGDVGLTQEVHGSVEGAGGSQSVERSIKFAGTTVFSGTVEG